MQTPLDSSIPTLPPLDLALLDNAPTSRPTTQLKQRFASRLTLTDILGLTPICEENTDRLSTDRSNISITQMQTLRAMKINTLRSMTEEECMRRYAKDPFFRKKVQSQVRSLRKSCSLVHLAGKIPDDSPTQIQKTIKLIDGQFDVTYRKIKEDDLIESIANKNKLEQVMMQMQLKIRSNKENTQ